VRVPGRAAVLAALTVVGTVLALAAALWPVVGPLTQRAALPPPARSVDGVPVPEPARRCAVQDALQPDSERWCLPAGVSAATLARWYRQALPPGADADGLRWCVEQYQEDGNRRALWSTAGGLVGYELPAQRPRPRDTASPATTTTGDELAVTVVRLPNSPCPAAARVNRR
jgi:hypothetical protein